MVEQKKKIVLGVCSSISIYKACEVVRGFQKGGFEVQVIMTRKATQLVSPLLFSSLSGLPTIVELFAEDSLRTIAHVSLARETALLAVAPATANIIGKFASGVADDFLSTFFMAVESPVLMAPAMNESMYLHSQTQENIQKLKSRGIVFIDPESGYLACQEEGWGRLASPEQIVRRGLELVQKSESLKGKTVLVTAGPTREFLDPVRFLSNRSSGKMGFELAREARRRGARVILVSGPTSLFPPSQIEFVKIQTARDMEEAVLKKYPEVDIVVMAAAVSDFQFASPSSQKVKKRAAPRNVRLLQTPDILGQLGRRKKGKFLVGFAAETENLVANARKKMKEKNLNLIIANNISQDGIGFDSDYNRVSLVDATGRVVDLERMTKGEVSRIIWDKIEDLIGRKS
ncbi:MAG: bifunctional phosphopantothenoylcysteine decarboxylase/phosphopantothenate--cysteine ligase CoaBC [Candidatus Aminicenantales bacterium]